MVKGDKTYGLVGFDGEAELEERVVKDYKRIFGSETVYFDVKKGVKSRKGNILSIPDGYLISFSGSSPRLYIVENEISEHPVYEHVSVQLLKFATSFGKGSRDVKEFLMEEIRKNEDLKAEVLSLMKRFPNISELLDYVIFKEDFGFIVVIDEQTEDLNYVLKQLAKQPDVIELKKYENEEDHDDVIYMFSEFQEDIKISVSEKVRDPSEMDTIVCPAREKDFERVFMGQDEWYAIRISSEMIPRIKYVAMYETAPVSAIRWVGKVEGIEPYEDTGKYRVVLSEKWELETPIELEKGEAKRGLAPRSPRYTKFELIENAKSMKDVF
ncbi:hypothetical protein AKJ43_03325 [candidate division MSBL1 archaeon SCGC-AAA261D19]|uniref:Uncharacterized protein n=1 Tax=candidate division MSBL1 archaeon SCGC-AAA261D19 TaxID=1698273 RepID=A0A133V4Z5_9EURY|nr:hypothetical protein AKJ43_03325 [candidate division MSBL1 archaeon SCGC-AAA261D19]